MPRGRGKVRGKAGQEKVHTVMAEFKRGGLHSGKTNKIVKSREQAIAIALSEGRRVSAGKHRMAGPRTRRVFS